MPDLPSRVLERDGLAAIAAVPPQVQAQVNARKRHPLIVVELLLVG